MAKLSLTANPTFKKKVGIPVAGSDAVAVELTFKHRTKSDLATFIDTRDEANDLDSMMDMVVAWDLEHEFNRDNVATLIENYAGAAVAVYREYVAELLRAKEKN